MKVLILGGNGMLGHVMVKHLASSGHDITFTVRDTMPKWMPFPLKAVSVLKFDATSKVLPSLEGFDFVVNCIGIIKQKQNVSPWEYAHVNSVFPWKLAMACKRAGVKLIHISSDCVFSGKSETRNHPLAPPDAEDDYGISKALGEPTDATVIRTSIIGPSDLKFGLFEWYRNNTDEKVPGYINHVWSGVTTLYLAQLVGSLMETPDQIPANGGLIQLTTAPITKFDLLNDIKAVFGKDWGKNNQEIVPTEAPETINRSLLPGTEAGADIKTQLTELKEWMAQNNE